MAFNGSGTFNRLYNWATDAANSVNISAARMDGEDNGFAAGLTNCITRDGQSPALANIPLGGFKITGLANGTASTDAATVGQVNTLLGSYLPLTGGSLSGNLYSSGKATFTSPNAGTTGAIQIADASGNPDAAYLQFTSFDRATQYSYIRGRAAGGLDLGGLITLDSAGSTLSSNMTVSGSIVPPSTPVVAGPGYLALPQNIQTTSYTLALTDVAHEIYMIGTTAGYSITIPANASVAFPNGTFIVITNDTSQSWGISIISDDLMWSPSGSLGARTLASRGTCTITKKSATRWWITGTGLT